MVPYQGFNREVTVSEEGWERQGLNELFSGRQPPGSAAVRFLCFELCTTPTPPERVMGLPVSLNTPSQDNASSPKLRPFPSCPFLGREGQQLSLTVYTQVFAPISPGCKSNTTCPSGHLDRPGAPRANSSAALHSARAVLRPQRQPVVVPRASRIQLGSAHLSFMMIMEM